LDRSNDDAGRDNVVLARGVAADGSPLPAADEADVVDEVAKYDVADVGEGMREELGVLTGVLSVLLKISAGGTHPEGLPGSLAD
jgi:hypothetical protein